MSFLQQGVAYHPIIDILRANFDVHGIDKDSDIREKVKRGLKTLGIDETSTLPIILEFLSVKDSGIDALPLSPEARKTFILEALKRIVLKGAEIRPLILAIEELVRSLKDLKVIEKKKNMYVATKDLHAVAIPSSIQDVIMARVDSLPGAAKKILQTGSVIGREFSYRLIKEVTGLLEQELLSHLSILKDSELIYERGIFPQSTYIFKHALTHDAAYQSLLKSTRQKLHSKVAQVLEERFPENIDTQPELLGHHFTKAGLVEKTIHYLQKAGEKAIRSSADMVAADHFTKAIELLQSLPESIGNRVSLSTILISTMPMLLFMGRTPVWLSSPTEP